MLTQSAFLWPSLPPAQFFLHCSRVVTESIFSAITERGSLTSRRGGASLVLGVERERTGGAEWVGVWWGTGGGYEDGEMQKERGGRAGGGERHAPYGVDLFTSVGSWEEVGDDIVICHRTTSGDGVSSPLLRVMLSAPWPKDAPWSTLLGQRTARRDPPRLLRTARLRTGS